LQSVFRIGTSGWHYKHWKGPFYPEDLDEAKMLEYYVERFNTVEINNTFYQLPEKKTLKQWRDLVPKDFLFCVKASRYITHMKKLKDPKESLKRFLGRVEVLRPKLGPILFQLPPRWNFNPDRLESFLDALPDDFRYTMEFRDETWFDEKAYKLLRNHKVAFCIYHLAGTLSPKEVTADFVYVRLHGPKGKYEGQYSKKDLSGWAGTFSSWAAPRRKVYCYFDNDQDGFATEDAARLQEMLS
jgi:uncharacterized protein YecE (DUF72 family)